MTHSIGNVRLKAARQHAGYASQQALADALTRAAPQLGLGHLEISDRQIRRWESASPPWPRADHQRLLVHVLQLPIEELGFTPPWDVSTGGPGAAAAAQAPMFRNPSRTPLPLAKSRGVIQPSTVAGDYAAITGSYRRLYTSVLPAHLHAAVIEHTRLGAHLLGETDGVSHTILATALAETLLLAGRIEFFDLRQPDDADATFVRALQAAGEADDALLGSAILAHAAFVPGWSERSDEFADRMRAARTYARRAPASAEFLAWLDAVEAECETIGGRAREALRLIEHAEAVLAAGSEHASPDWFTWFSPMRLAAFKGNTQLKAGTSTPGQGHADRRAQRRDGRRRQATHRHPRRLGRRRSRPAQPRSCLRLRRTGPPATRHHLVRHRHGSHPRRPQGPPALGRARLRAGPR